MNQDEKLIDLSLKVIEFRKANGFQKKLSFELQSAIAELCNSGVTAYAIEKAIGIQRNTIKEWAHKYQPESKFSEVNIVNETKANFEIKVSTAVQNCRVEITGSDYSLLQRLLRKLS